MSIVTLAELPAKNIFAGVTGHYAHLSKMTFGEVELAADTVVPLHQHPHDQCSYVLAGRVEFTVGHETRMMQAGDCAVIPGGTTHGCRTLTACRILDTFAPAREDYR
jgi:quercetin dioxygenase-like cupin family protein